MFWKKKDQSGRGGWSYLEPCEGSGLPSDSSGLYSADLFFKTTDVASIFDALQGGPWRGSLKQTTFSGFELTVDLSGLLELEGPDGLTQDGYLMSGFVKPSEEGIAAIRLFHAYLKAADIEVTWEVYGPDREEIAHS